MGCMFTPTNCYIDCCSPYHRFLWVHLQILAICREHTPRDVRNALATLPKGLDKTYMRIIENISKIEGTGTLRAVQTVLKWLLYTQQLVAPDTIIDVLTVTPGEALPDNFRWTLDLILNTCHNLVIYDERVNTFRFAHFSVQEFLIRQPEFGPEHAHTNIAEVCLTVLTHQFETKSNLKSYSIHHWGPHVHLSGGGSPILEGLWKGFLMPASTPSPAYISWTAALVQEFGNRTRRFKGATELLQFDGVLAPLLVAAIYQLFDIFKFIVNSGADVNCHNAEMYTH